MINPFSERAGQFYLAADNYTFIFNYLLMTNWTIIWHSKFFFFPVLKSGKTLTIWGITSPAETITLSPIFIPGLLISSLLYRLLEKSLRLKPYWFKIATGVKTRSTNLNNNIFNNGHCFFRRKFISNGSSQGFLLL